MDDFTPDPFKNYVMKGNPPKQVAPPQPDPIDEQTLASLYLMTKEELITLITRVSGAMWGIGLMDETQTAEAMMLRLAVNGLTTRDAKDCLGNIREWLDRKQGKAMQRVEVKAAIATFDLDQHRQEVRRQALEDMERLAKVTISSQPVINKT